MGEDAQKWLSSFVAKTRDLDASARAAALENDEALATGVSICTFVLVSKYLRTSNMPLTPASLHQRTIPWRSKGIQT